VPGAWRQYPLGTPRPAAVSHIGSLLFVPAADAFNRHAQAILDFVLA
jgi:hypothetical protein